MLNFEAHMRKGAGAALEKKQDDMSMEELTALFEKVAIRDLEIGEAWNELVSDIRSRLTDLTDSPGAENVADDIAERHQEMLKEEKGLEDRRQQAAYVIALAKQLRRRNETAH